MTVPPIVSLCEIQGSISTLHSDLTSVAAQWNSTQWGHTINCGHTSSWNVSVAVALVASVQLTVTV